MEIKRDKYLEDLMNRISKGKDVHSFIDDTAIAPNYLNNKEQASNE
ncbi:MAG: hypothetical protein IKN45_08855 [Lachnospiraceae bacterium]|nr:hypothetical protein [Lachnospiraceae bacterium]